MDERVDQYIKMLNAHLVVINNAEEDREIVKMMNSNDGQGPFYIWHLIVKVVSN